MDDHQGAKRRKGEDIRREACTRKPSEDSSRRWRYHTRYFYDYTVIIGWKGWCAFEAEADEEGVEALVRKRKQRQIVEREWECKHRHKIETDIKPLCISIDEVPTVQEASVLELSIEEQVDKSQEMPVGTDIPLLNGDHSAPNSSSQQQIQSQAERLLQDGSHVAHVTMKIDGEMSKDQQRSENSGFNVQSLKEEFKDQQRSENSGFNVQSLKEEFILQDSRVNIACNTQESNTSSNDTKMPPCVSAPSGPQVCDDKRELCSSFVDMKADSMVKNGFDEGNDTVVLKGKIKMSDIQTIYGKSLVVIDHLKTDEAFGEPVAAKIMRTDVKYERRNKRIRENMGGSDVNKGASVKCPICDLIICGDIQDAGFNNQFNLHVDSCMGLRFK